MNQRDDIIGNLLNKNHFNSINKARTANMLQLDIRNGFKTKFNLNRCLQNIYLLIDNTENIKYSKHFCAEKFHKKRLTNLVSASSD